MGDALPRSFNEYCTDEGPDRDSVQSLVCDGLCVVVGNFDQNIVDVKTALEETPNERLASAIASIRFSHPNTGEDLTGRMQTRPLESGPLKARLSVSAAMMALTPLPNLNEKGRRKRAANSGATFIPTVSESKTVILSGAWAKREREPEGGRNEVVGGRQE